MIYEKMLRAFKTSRATPAFIFSVFEHNKHDKDYLGVQKSHEETGKDRLHKMFTRNEYDEISVELHTILQSSTVGCFIGAIMGGIVKSREAYLYFIENNQATIFNSPMTARKKLQDFVTVGFAKGAYHWGWRLGAFTAIFSLVSTSVSVYRGKTSIIEYTTGGAVAGALYKANLGLAATCVSAAFGAVLSTIAGLCILGILAATGTSMDEIRKALFALREAREDQMNQVFEKASSEKHDDLTRHHDSLVEEKGVKKIEEI